MMTKQIILLTLILNNSFILIAQTETSNWDVNLNDPFNQVNTPVSDGLELWLTRQNFTTKGYQAIYEFDYNFNNNQENLPQNLTLTNYFNLFATKRWSSMAGIRYKKYNLMSNKEMDNNFQHLFLWHSIQFIPNDKWNLGFAYEIYKAGNETNFNKQTGDRIFYYFSPIYAVSEKLSIIPVFFHDLRFKDNSEIDGSIIGGLQARWVLNNNFKLLIGAPMLFGTEWTINKKLKFATYLLYNFENTSFLQYNFSDKLSLAFHYSNATNFSHSYILETEFIEETNSFTHNKVNQRQHRFALELGIKKSNNSSVQLTIGYKKGDDIKLLNNDKELYSFAGTDYFFIGASFYFLDYKSK